MPGASRLRLAVVLATCWPSALARHWLRISEQRSLRLHDDAVSLFPAGNESTQLAAANPHDIDILSFDRATEGTSRSGPAKHAPMRTSTRVASLCAVAVLIFIAVSPVLHSEGLPPFLAVLSYIVCICFVKVFAKQAFNAGFHFPYTLTAMHMLVTAVVSSLIERPLLGSALGTLRISIAKAASLGLSNSALVFGNAAFVSVISALTPCTTFTVDVFRTRRMDAVRLLSVLLSCAGAGICSGGDATFSLLALLLALGACLCRSLKTVWSHDLLQADVGVYSLVAWSSIWSFLIMLAVGFGAEGLAPYRELGVLSARGCVGLVVSCVAATMLNILQCFVLKFLGPVLQSLFGSLELVAVIMLAVVVLGEEVSRVEWAGALLVCFGCASAKIEPFARAAAKRAAAWLLPGLESQSSGPKAAKA